MALRIVARRICKIRQYRSIFIRTARNLTSMSDAPSSRLCLRVQRATVRWLNNNGGVHAASCFIGGVSNIYVRSLQVDPSAATYILMGCTRLLFKEYKSYTVERYSANKGSDTFQSDLASTLSERSFFIAAPRTV